MDDRRERLQAKLAPEAVAQALIQAGAFLTGYELLKSSIIDDVRSFYSFGLTEDGKAKVDARYARDVLALDPSPRKNVFRASMAWLVAAEALEPVHVEALERIRAHRGDIAHELARLLVDPDAGVDTALLGELRAIRRALDRFWGSIHVASDPDFDGVDIDLNEVRSGSGLLFDFLADLSGVEQQKSSRTPTGSDKPRPTGDNEPRT